MMENQNLSTNENTKNNINLDLAYNPDIISVNLDVEIDKAIQMRDTFNKLFSNVLQQGIDFDRIPGSEKPTLLKPGADLLCQIFHFASGEPKILSSIEDFEKGIFSYTVSIPINHRDTGTVVGVGIGSSNSYEIKYKYRYVDSEGGEKQRVENPEPADQQNTLVKMAAKRAYIDGVLKATGASRMFTQDIEDMPWLQQEKASSKQIKFIKALYKDSAENEILEDASKIAKRELNNLEDLYKDEASLIINAKKGFSQAHDFTSSKSYEKPREDEYTCSRCGTRISQGVAAYSQNKYKRHLCGNCQKESEVLQ